MNAHEGHSSVSFKLIFSTFIINGARGGLLAGALLAGLGALPALAQTARPAWIEALPDRPGRLYAMGVAQVTTSEAQAVKQASQNAKVEVVGRLRSSVKGETTLQSSSSVQRALGGPTTASARQTVDQNASISAQAMDLPGLAVAETWVDGPGRAAYALGYLDVTNSLMDIQSRLDDVKRLAEGGAPADPRERARAIQGLKKGRTELARLDRWADLLAAGTGSAFVRADVRAAQQTVQGRLDELKAGLTLGLDGAALPPELATVVQNGALAAGLGWSRKPEFTVKVGFGAGGKAGAWWDLDGNSDFITARGVLQLSLADRAGHAYEAAPVDASGVGTSDVSAHQALLKEAQKKVEAAFDRWLSDLAL